MRLTERFIQIYDPTFMISYVQVYIYHKSLSVKQFHVLIQYIILTLEESIRYVLQSGGKARLVDVNLSFSPAYTKVSLFNSL